jgi:hypothetical protein
MTQYILVPKHHIVTHEYNSHVSIQNSKFGAGVRLNDIALV